MQAYSTETNTEYDSWEELLKAETNGYVVVIISDRPGTVPYVIGPFDTQDDAVRARKKIQRKEKQAEAPHKVHAFVRNLWKKELYA